MMCRVKKSNLGRLGTGHPSPGRPCPPLFISSLAQAAPSFKKAMMIDRGRWRISVAQRSPHAPPARHQDIKFSAQNEGAGEGLGGSSRLQSWTMDMFKYRGQAGERVHKFSTPRKGKKCEGRSCPLSSLRIGLPLGIQVTNISLRQSH